MAELKTYVRTDEFGVMRVGNTRVMIEGVIHAFREGQSPESIRSQYPSLSLEEVYGAIAYVLAHSDEIDAYLKKQEKIWEQARLEQERNLPPVVARLRETKTKAEAT